MRVRRSINVPLKPLDFLERQKQSTGLEASLIHLSTDQVPDLNRFAAALLSTSASPPWPRRRGGRFVLTPCLARQVYDGGKAFWKESDPCKPVNAYGVTKLEAEEAIKVRSQISRNLSTWFCCNAQLFAAPSAGKMAPQCDPEEQHHLWPGAPSTRGERPLPAVCGG